MQQKIPKMVATGADFVNASASGSYKIGYAQTLFSKDMRFPPFCD